MARESSTNLFVTRFDLSALALLTIFDDVDVQRLLRATDCFLNSSNNETLKLTKPQS